jgi:hypothetical protein
MIEYARWGRIEHRPPLAMPSRLPAVAKITTVSLPAMPESAGPAIKKIGRGDASELKLPNATYATPRFRSTKEQLVTDLSMSAQRVKARSVHAITPYSCFLTIQLFP